MSLAYSIEACDAIKRVAYWSKRVKGFSSEGNTLEGNTLNFFLFFIPCDMQYQTTIMKTFFFDAKHRVNG